MTTERTIITIRVPRELHQRLANHCQQQNVSMNSFCNDVLNAATVADNERSHYSQHAFAEAAEELLREVDGIDVPDAGYMADGGAVLFRSHLRRLLDM